MINQIAPKEKLDEWHKNDLRYLNNIINNCLIPKKRIPIIEFVESRRFLNLGPSPGFYSFKKTPYLREIIKCFDYNSPVQIVDLIKGAQIGATVGIGENWLLYIIAENPSSAMFVAQTQDVAENIIEKRLDPAIDSAGLRHLIISQKQSSKNRSTGDTANSKEFLGGFINIAGLQSVARLKSFSIEYLYITEVDEAPMDIGGQGSPVSLVEKRQDAYEITKKMLCESTPTDSRTSVIEPRFKLGDQRYYNVPCKHCGELQVLEFNNLKYDLDDDGILITGSVFYECKFCRGKLKNIDKEYFLLDEETGGKAKWIATAKSTNPRRRSYQISSLYSPFKSWEAVILEFLQAKEAEDAGDNRKMRVFTNQILGEAFKEIEYSPNYMLIKQNNSGAYLKEYFNDNGDLIDCNIVFDDLKYRPLFCTMAADIQKNYIEVGVMLWAFGMRSYMIGYHRFTGNTVDINDRCWHQFEKLIKSKHNGIYASIVFVDYGYNSSVVATFCEKMHSQIESGSIVFPIKGVTTGKLYNISNETKKNPPLININVNKSKEYVYTRLVNKIIADEIPNEYCSFAADLEPEYFKMLTAEEMTRKTSTNGSGKYEWVLKRGHKRNEALDIMGYNIIAAFFLCDSLASKNKEGVTDWQKLWEFFQTDKWALHVGEYLYKVKCPRCKGSLNYYNEKNELETCGMCEDGYFYY